MQASYADKRCKSVEDRAVEMLAPVPAEWLVGRFDYAKCKSNVVIVSIGYCGRAIALLAE